MAPVPKRHPLPQYRYGNNARNNLIGPSLVDVDFSVANLWKLRESRHLEVRGGCFNLPNHPLFGQPNLTLGTGFGGIGSTRIDSREIQFALKLND